MLPSNPPDVTRDKASTFYEEELEGLHRKFTVYVPRVCYLTNSSERQPLIDPDRAPVLLFEELFTLSPSVLELAQRLSSQGFAVYVPILFGSASEDPNNPWLALYRGASFAFGMPDWKANASDADERPVVREIGALCGTIAARHPHKKMGAIGLCITGSFPLELLAENSSRIAAPVLSQPAIPVIANTFYRRESLGMSEKKLRDICHRVLERHLQVQGFRFQLDTISPPERFAHLRSLLGANFLDDTLPASDYVYRDHCPPNAHAVLTDGYSEWARGEREKRGHFAYRQLVWFLKTRLNDVSLPEPIYNR